MSLTNLYGADYYHTETKTIIEARSDDLYYYQVYIGAHTIVIEQGDCVYYLSNDSKQAMLKVGPSSITSMHVATVIRGYMPENKTSTLQGNTTLPYVNGCSTKQIFPPDRLGDPTLQLLAIPPYTSEQAHHIHSTVRVVYILSGSGQSVVGMGQHTTSKKLVPGMVAIFQKMCPHHFETGEEPLKVLPLHVFSSVGSQEFQHPMFHGTHLTKI